MKISVAQALKEKKRLVGEIAYLWQLFQNENSALETHTRKIDVKQTLQTIDHYTAKLVELKTKISVANQGEHLRTMQLRDDAKRRLEKLSETSGSEDPEIYYDKVVISTNPHHKVTERTAVFNEEQLDTMKRTLRREIGNLQDQLDVYNARTFIDFETPLK